MNRHPNPNMNLILKSKTFLMALALVAACAVQAQEWNVFNAQPATTVKIEGTSTIHDWTMEGQIIKGSLKLKKDLLFDATTKAGKVEAEATASIPVRSLKSGKTTMDEIMQQAMNAKDHEKIDFKLTELVIKEVPADVKNPFPCEGTGELTINGKTNKITLPVEIVKINPVRLEVRGKKALKMTDYGVTPPAPSIAGGLIKTGDEITISFVWKIAVKVEGAKPAAAQ